MIGSARWSRLLTSGGELDNTVFVFTSDHGDCLGDHHQVYKFSSHYDSVARVPLVFAGPGVGWLGVRDPLVELIDLGPTLLEMAGLGPLAGAAGFSLGAAAARGREPHCTRLCFPSTDRVSWREPRRGNWFFYPRGTLWGAVSFRRGSG